MRRRDDRARQLPHFLKLSFSATTRALSGSRLQPAPSKTGHEPAQDKIVVLIHFPVVKNVVPSDIPTSALAQNLAALAPAPALLPGEALNGIN